MASTLSTAAVVWTDDWRIPYLAVGSLSVFMAFAAKQFLRMTVRTLEDASAKQKDLSLLAIFHRISNVPVFLYLVAQGVFGAIPWVSELSHPI